MQITTMNMNMPSFPSFHRTEFHKQYSLMMRSPDSYIILARGSAGTGKTYTACRIAAEKLQTGEIRKLVLTRPVVSADEDIGFLPGGINEKMAPWAQPMLDALAETMHGGYPKIEALLNERVIEIAPLGFMRGRTFKKCWVIADEMQNSTVSQMKMIVTRLGDGSKIIITGDPTQSDLPAKITGGLDHFYDMIHMHPINGINCIDFPDSCIVRHPVVREIISMYRDMEQLN